jgi:hypothetical protein
MKTGLPLSFSICLFSICLINSAFSQNVTLKEIPVDTVSPSPIDTARISKYVKRFNPRKALFYSAILPGMGQVYNKKYWKVPLVYGGFYTGVIVINFYEDQFIKYKNELFTLLNDPSVATSPTGLTQDQLRSIINKARRQRDFWCIITGVWYMLQIVDAHVDAHLKEFDVNPQLKVKIEPMMESDQMIGRTTGFSIKLKF